MIVNSDTVVPAAWLERLRAAAHSDGLVATASTLTNHGTILSVPDRTVPSPLPPPGLSITEADARIARASPRLHPRIPTGVGHCLYIRRAALELVGDFDEAFSPGYGEEVDFCQRCTRARAAPRRRRRPLRLPPRRGLVRQRAHRAPAGQRGRAQPPLPVLREGGAGSRDVGDDPARALAGGRAARGRRAVGDDRRLLPRPDADRHAGARTRAGRRARAAAATCGCASPSRARSATAPARRSTASGIERMWHDEADEDTEPSDIVHRPYQVTTPRDLLLLGRLGRRVVLTQLDSIAYHNPAYFTDYERVARLPRADPPGARVRAPRRVLLAPRPRRLARRGPRRRRARRAGRARHRPPRGGGRTVEPVAPAGRRGPAVPALPRHRLPAQEPPVRARAVPAPARGPRLRRPARAGRPARAARAPARARRRRGAPRTLQLAADVVALGECPGGARRRGCTATPRSCSTRRRSRASASSPSRPPRRARRRCGPTSPRWPTCCPASTPGSCRGTSRRAPANAARLIADPQPALVEAVRKAGAELTWDRCAEQLLASTATPRPHHGAPRPSRASRSPTSRCRSSAPAAGSAPTTSRRCSPSPPARRSSAPSSAPLQGRLPGDVPGAAGGIERRLSLGSELCGSDRRTSRLA